MSQVKKSNDWSGKLLDLALWYQLVFSCMLIPYAGIYFGDVYRSTWSWPLEDVFWLATIGYLVLILWPTLSLLAYCGAVYVETPVGLALVNCTYLSLVLGLIHGTVATPFTEFGALPWTWASWWSAFPVGIVLIFVLFLIDLPRGLRRRAEIEQRRRIMYTSPWL